MIRVLDLFSGVGGFSLGLERAGMRTIAFCEIEPFCRAVLAKHWPEVPCYDDVRTLTAYRLAADGVVPDLICGGFPCQDISIAGRGAGLAGERSGLWREYARLIGEIRPRWIIIENVPALRSRGLDEVLGSLAALGYDAEWHCIPAAAVGARHRRDRLWVVAHPNSGRGNQPIREIQAGGDVAGSSGEILAHSAGEGRQAWPCSETSSAGTTGLLQPAGLGCHVANPSGAGLPAPERPEWGEPFITPADIGRAVAKCGWRGAVARMGGTADGAAEGLDRYPVAVEAWEEGTPRTVAAGTPNRVPRLKALGNSVVPQIPELIGRAIMRAEGLA